MDRVARPYLIIAILAIPCCFLLFKEFYPFASYFTDSYAYLWAAVWREHVSIRPIGYSWFLIAAHWLHSSDGFLVFLQYVLLQTSALYLFFTIRRLYPLPRKAQNLFFAMVLVNPCFLYMANSVSSDALFISLGLIWFVEMIWLIELPGWGRMLRLLIVMTLLFYVRYTALMCPVVLAIAFCLARSGKTFAFAGIAAGFVVIGLNVLLIREITWRKTGIRTFAAFSAWQIANNALHIYPYISADHPKSENSKADSVNSDSLAFDRPDLGNPDAHRSHPDHPSPNIAKKEIPESDSPKIHNQLPGSLQSAGTDWPDPETKELDGWVRRYFDSAGISANLRAHPLRQATTDYMWNEALPLRRYYRSIEQREHLAGLRSWTRVDPVFTRYGNTLIRRYPFLYLRYYIVPSANTYFWPDLDILSRYNEGLPNVDSVAIRWFGYPSDRVYTRWQVLQRVLMEPARWLYLFLNILFLAAIATWMLSGRWREWLKLSEPVFCRSALLLAGYWVVYTAFSIYATMTVFRYQLMLLILLLPFVWKYFSLYWSYRSERERSSPVAKDRIGQERIV